MHKINNLVFVSIRDVLGATTLEGDALVQAQREAFAQRPGVGFIDDVLGLHTYAEQDALWNDMDFVHTWNECNDVEAPDYGAWTDEHALAYIEGNTAYVLCAEENVLIRKYAYS